MVSLSHPFPLSLSLSLLFIYSFSFSFLQTLSQLSTSTVLRQELGLNDGEDLKVEVVALGTGEERRSLAADKVGGEPVLDALVLETARFVAREQYLFHFKARMSKQESLWGAGG